MIVRSKQPLLYDALESRSGIISPKIQSLKRNLSGSYEVVIHDRLQVERQNPEIGTSLFKYEFLRERVKFYSSAEINQLFDLFGETIVKGESDFDAKFVAALPESLLFISNTTSIYGSVQKTQEEILGGVEGAFELVDETLEVAPEPA